MALTNAVRTALLPSQQDAEAEELGLRAMNRQLGINGTPEIVKGWNSAGISEDANALYTQAAKAYDTGDMQGGQVFEQQARDLDQQAAVVAPRVRSLRDINGFGDAMDWLGGSLGNMRSSVKPALGGLAGAVVGTVAAPFTGGVVNPLTAGAVGGTLAGYDSEADEAIASAMRDPEIRSTRTMQDIINTGRVKGVGTSFLEAAVPAVMGGKLVGAGAKAVAKGGGIKHAAKVVGEGAAGEFVTEGTQSLAGQAAQNSLLNKPLNDFDYMQALDEAAAGAVAGGGMGAIGGGADVLHSKLQGGVDKVNEVRKDPAGAVADTIADAGTAVGKGAAKLEDWVQRATSAPHRSRDALVQSERVAVSDEDRVNHATNWASHVLENPNDFSEQERSDASEFIKTGNATLYRDKLSITHHEKQIATADSAIVDEIAERLGKKSKSSKMSPTLVDDFGEIEGRDSSGDSVVDDFGNRVRSGFSGVDARSHAELSQIGQPVIPKQGLSVKGQNKATVENVADIWRKQGVSEKLLKATSEQTDSKQREMAIALMGWMQNGFKDVDGEVFVPEKFLDTYGKNAPKLIRQAAEQALLHGLIDADTFNKLPEIETLAQTQHADNTATFDAVVGNMTEAARNAYSADSLKEFVPEMRRMAQDGMSKREEEFLLRLYGSKDKINAAMAKFKDKGQQSVLVSAAEKRTSLDEDGNALTDDNALAEDDYENDVEVAPGEERVTYRGVGDKHVPYNTTYDDKRNALTTELSALANEPKLFARKMGAWTALKEQYGHNATLLREKEDEALAKSVGRESISEMDDERRTSLLKAYNKTHKVIKVVESVSEKLPDTITPQQIESFREKSENKQIKGEWVAGAGNTPEYGKLYLERKERINTETGEATGKNEAFLTSAARLIKHVWKSEGEQSEGRTNANAGKGSVGEYRAFLRGLAALIQSDGSFTGRVGVMVDGKIKILGNKDALPKNLRLMKGTIADAKRQQTRETLSGDPMGAPLSDKDVLVEAGDEITPYTDRNIVPSESTSLEARADTLLAEGSLGEIHRDARGVQKGLGLDAEAFAVGGHAPTSEKAVDPATAPLATKPVERSVGSATNEQLVALEKVESAKDWVVSMLANADKFRDMLAKIGSMSKEQLEVLSNAVFGNTTGLVLREHKGGLLDLSPDKFASLYFPQNADKGKMRLTRLKNYAETIRSAITDRKAGVEGGRRSEANSEKPSAQLEKPSGEATSREDSHGRSGGPAVAATTRETAEGLGDTARNDGAERSGVGSFSWARYADNGYEVSSAGDKRFSALNAKLKDGRTIEEAYQLDVKGFRKYGDDWRIGKGKKPLNKIADSYAEYKKLWQQWANENPELMADLRKRADGKVLTDKFANTDVSQARALAEILDTKPSASKPTTIIKQHASSGYRQRTALNANSADVTIAFAIDHNTAGEKLTASLAGNRLVKFEGSLRKFTDAIIEKLKATNGNSINVAGNGIYTWAKQGVDQAKVNEMMFKVLREVNKAVPLKKVVTGGQTGSDIAGAIAAQALGIHTEVTMPQGFRQRNAESVDFTQSEADVRKQIADGVAGLGKQSAVNADIQGRQAKQEEVDAAVKHLTDTLGDSVKVDFKKWFGDNSSGRWTERRTRNLIELALNGDVLGTAYHESMHEFFNQLGRNGAENVQALMKRVATNKVIMRQLHKLLKDHEKAIEQLNDPEEALAYMYQFWQAGLLKIGPDTQTFFEKVANLIRSVFRRVQPEIKDMQQAEMILRAFSGGALKESATKAAVIESMRKDTEAHDKAIEAVGKGANALVNAFGKVVFSAEAMMEATGNKYMVNIARRANQKAGERMRGQAYFDALHQNKGVWMNKLENLISGADKDTLNIARDTLNSEGVTHHPAAKQLVAAVRGFMDQMYDYTYERGVRRWDADAVNAKWGTKGDWVPMPKRANYFSRMWSTQTLLAKRDEFMKRLLEHHSSELNHIAAEANAELDSAFSGKGGKLGISAQAAVDKAQTESGKAMVSRKEVAAVTAEHVAEAIFARLINANGFVDLAESVSSLGMSPAASAVNKRELSWIKGEHFNDFFEQDLVKVLTTYTQSMVKRAEYTRAFGAGGEKLAEQGDKAVLFELGGDKLIAQAERGMEAEVTAWKKRKAQAVAAGLEFHEPFPTLRSVGQRIHSTKAGSEQAGKDLVAAIRKLDHGFKAIMAIEGTLGNDISPAARQLNSSVITYQTLRLMTTGLFSSFNDVMGIVVNGGTLGDAWDGFVRSMREIKLHWQDKKSEDAQAKRAEVWGTVEATAALDALGQTFGSMYLTGNAKRFSDAFFKWNGMEAWNRAMRITATTVAERTLKLYKAEGFDIKDKAAAARFERLYGKNFNPADITLDADGNLDTTDPRNQAAVMRWVSDAIMLPNATHRTIWGSDPHFAAFWQFKQFAYTLHRVMLKGALEQAKLGNYRPAMTMVLGYAPVMIAADAVKEMLIPGDEPPWMKMGLGGMISHGFARGGVGGVPQMMFEGASRDFGLSLLGPTVSQISDAISDPLARTALGGLPAGSLLRRAADN